MDKKGERIFKENSPIVGFIISILGLIGGVVWTAFGYIHIIFYITGGIFTLLMVIANVKMFFLNSVFIDINPETISEIRLFGKVKKSQRFVDLMSITTIIFRFECYLCFNFSSEDVSKDDITDLEANSKVILLAYSKKNEAIVKKYTNVPIISCQKKTNL